MLAAATVLFVATITPGPNNLIVSHTAAMTRPGFVLAPASGIIVGTVGLIVLAWLGFAAFGQVSDLGLLAWIPVAILAFIGVSMIRSGWTQAQGGGTPSVFEQRPVLFAGAMAAFQITNPKSWLLALAVTGAHRASPSGTLFDLVLLAVAVLVFSIAVWALAGRALRNVMDKVQVRRWLHTVTGAIMLAFAAGLAPVW
ncbi:LysE family translocator [Thalassococcus sp. S3]|uniref:LysE family translocator n=1 Tax=Thalassococcus sp. S3 TaxID=2017482 RepID=UPI00102471C8|nr:LysE family transporter [Thalassococcus sp. S3]QBF32045.1 hypothetical protein CFI11_12550 [Thalassococcus sp. S3]